MGAMADDCEDGVNETGSHVFQTSWRDRRDGDGRRRPQRALTEAAMEVQCNMLCCVQPA